MRKPLFLLFLLLGAAGLTGQSFTDALRYSDVAPQGSARFFGTGGSLTPLGVDYTTLHTNPAGIGWNRNSSVHISPGFRLTDTETFLTNETRDPDGNPRLSDSESSFNFPSAGIIFSGTTRSVNWSRLNFGVGITRLADYNQTVNFSGRSQRSIVDAIVDDLNFALDNPGEVFPFRADLLQQIPNALFEDELGFFSDFDLAENEGGEVRREGRINRSGSMNEVAIGFGGNYRESFLWGLSIGIPFFTFEEDYDYDEIDDLDEITSFDDAAFDQNLSANGTGFNIKLGATYLPSPQVRLSAAVHSPTFWTVDEEFFTDLTYNFTSEGVAQGGTAQSDLAATTFNLRTPWRFMLGGGLLIGNKGFVSLDADYADFATNNVSFDDFATAADATNADIEAILGSSFGVRLGGELNLQPFQVRAGVGYRQVPFAEFVNDEDEAILSYSAGLGYSVGKFFVDVAARYDTYASFQEAYQTFGVVPQIIDTERTRITGIITVGVRGFQLGF